MGVPQRLRYSAGEIRVACLSLTNQQAGVIRKDFRPDGSCAQRHHRRASVFLLRAASRKLWMTHRMGNWELNRAGICAMPLSAA